MDKHITNEIRSSGIMLDNWFIEEALSYMAEGITYGSTAYAELLAAIVLWDNVYYPRNANSVWATWDQNPLAKYLTPIDDEGEEGYREAVEAFHQYPHVFEKQYWRKLVKPGLPNEVVGVGALRYMSLSAKHNCDYLPSGQRQEFLKAHLSQEDFSSLMGHLTAQKVIDDAIADYVIQAAQPFLSPEGFFIEMPAFARFIIDHTPIGMSSIEFALHLKHEGPVCRYREYLQQFSVAAGERDVLKLQYLRSLVKEAFDTVVAKYGDDMKSGPTQILPALLPPADLSSAIEKAFVFEKMLRESDRKMRLVFLKDLTYHTTRAFQGRNDCK